VFECPSDPQFDNPSTGDAGVSYAERENAWRSCYGFITHKHDGSFGGYTYEEITDSNKAIFGGFNGAARIRDVNDGTSNTMAMIETKMEKYDTYYGPYWNMYVYTHPSSPATHGINRPSCYWYPGTADCERIYAWGAGSWHPGGCMLLMGDGSVRFISDTTHQQTVSALVSMSAHDIVPEF
jgi:prepilin-type processing-associated H-X9-DG protein